MAKKHKQHNEEAWANAKKICRLSARQVEMARALGMNPKKLPGLRPSPQQRWKLPVGEFIEECYWKRFGRSAAKNEPSNPKPGSHEPSPVGEDGQPPAVAAGDPMWRAPDLICYLMNLTDDLQAWLAQGTLTPEVLTDISRELREIADALDTGAPIPQVPEIPPPPRGTRAPSQRRDSFTHTLDDDDIPF